MIKNNAVVGSQIACALAEQTVGTSAPSGKTYSAGAPSKSANAPTSRSYSTFSRTLYSNKTPNRTSNGICTVPSSTALSTDVLRRTFYSASVPATRTSAPKWQQKPGSSTGNKAGYSTQSLTPERQQQLTEYNTTQKVVSSYFIKEKFYV